MSASRSTMPTQKPARSKASASISPGCSAVSPPTSAQPASAQPSATPPTSSATALRVELADGHVVEEEERPRAVADDIVGAHRHQVAADAVAAAEQARDLGLGADAVGGTHQHGPAITGRQLQRGTEPAQPTQQVVGAGAGRHDALAQQAHRAVARRHVHAGGGVGGPCRRVRGAGHRSGSASSSSTNLWEATS